MDYKELIDPELRKSANSFPFNSVQFVSALFRFLLPASLFFCAIL